MLMNDEIKIETFKNTLSEVFIEKAELHLNWLLTVKKVENINNNSIL